MSRWEYKTLDLVLEIPLPGEQYEKRAQAVWDRVLAQAGSEGWEAVGQVTLSNGKGRHFPGLLMKRPVDEA